MSSETPGSQGRPLRVAIVGAGPAGFYAAEALFRQKAVEVEIDLLERLPVPFGLLRAGVAPDHQRIKRASAAFERTASDPRFRFLGNVDIGSAVSMPELFELYDQVLICTGSSTDRRLGVPGEDLEGSHAATSFVGWYNANPDFVDERFDLSTPRAVIVGIGNVAIDVTRILVRDPDELASTDIAGYALEALRASQVREVVLLARRGTAEAACDEREIRALAELPGVQVRIADATFPDAGADLDRVTRDKLAYLAELAAAPESHAPRTVTLQFLASPVEILGEERVRGVRVQRNQLVDDGHGGTRAEGTAETFEIETGLVFRSIGYVGVPVPGLPFDARVGVIPNADGRITDGRGGAVIPRAYVAGWIKRGATGVIGTNKSDAHATVESMLADVGDLAGQPPRNARAVDELLAARGVHVASFIDWQVLDDLERAAGHSLGKVREKFTRVDEMMHVLKTTRPPPPDADPEE